MIVRSNSSDVFKICLYPSSDIYTDFVGTCKFLLNPIATLELLSPENQRLKVTKSEISIEKDKTNHCFDLLTLSKFLTIETLDITSII